MNHIELFAGCGGLSLGLEKAGFDLTLANELSPMAAETFTYNFLGENLAELAKARKAQNKALWLSSQYQSNDLTQRLRENPFQYPIAGDGITDIPLNPRELEGKLVVGNIADLNKLLEEKPKFRKALMTGFGREGVDLVSGGPPCQSFSMAGLRNRDCEKNVLPWEFARFVSMVKPKFAILENVTGILRAFTEDGISYHAWFEVAKAFSKINYIPICLHINARLAGVPQNRPRFIMIGVRSNLYKKLYKNLNANEIKLISPGVEFQKRVAKDMEGIEFGELPYFDVKKEEDLALLEGSFLKHLVCEQEVSVKEALDDLRFNNPSKKSKFVKNLNKFFENQDTATIINNHEPRKNGPLVQRRFRLYQILQKCERSTINEVFEILKRESSTLSEQAWKNIKEYKFLIESNELVFFNNKNDLIKFLSAHPTKKRTQKALDQSLPAPAALSIPDDACHYHDNELRTLTVREMARIQSFPDNFTFRSKVTTGGKMRKFEVPQYTQVGNAVPPLLGLALGKAIIELASRI